MAIEALENTTLFYYDIEKLFSTIVVKTGYRARHIHLPPGKFAEDYMINDNDRDVFDTLYPVVSSLIYEAVSILAQGVVVGYEYDVTVEYCDNWVITYQLDYPDGFDPNQEIPLDRFLNEALVSGIMWKWFELCGLYDEATYWRSEYDKNIASIKKSVLYRTERTRIPYRTF